MVDRPFWLVLADPLSTRVFFDCGILAKLQERLAGRLRVAFVFPWEQAEPWARRLTDVPVLHEADLYPASAPAPERVRRRLDRGLDRRLGYYPLAIRLNYRHGFHRERMHPGHPNLLLDSTRAGPLPRWASLERAMFHWHFSPRRYVPSALLSRLRAERPAVCFSNLQMQAAVPFIVAGRRLGLPLVGYVASWDHTVGKGVISPHLERYVVQNDVMRDDLVRFHDIEADRIAVTGWPQTDLFHIRRPREAYLALLERLGLASTRPLVLFMGNTPTNAPYEGRLVERLVAWQDEHARNAPSLLFRPHPRDKAWRERFAPALGRTGAAVQEPSYSDLEDLATLLQHGDCVVSNAGTILLDALVNDRPAVCVLYDEGAPPGESWAAKNVVGEHYRELVDSGAFLRAERFDQVSAGIERCLAHPDELAGERRRVVRTVVGEVDGHVADRCVEAILSIDSRG